MPVRAKQIEFSGFLIMSERTPPRTGAFRHAGFRLYWIARFLDTFSAQIMGVSVGWQVYDLTRDPFDLGMVGLALFLPAFLLVLVTGAVAWGASTWQIATVLGPVAGGLLYGMSPEAAYIISFLLLAIATVLAASIRVVASAKDTDEKEKRLAPDIVQVIDKTLREQWLVLEAPPLAPVVAEIRARCEEAGFPPPSYGSVSAASRCSSHPKKSQGGDPPTHIICSD
jgi:MFS family permease